MRYFCVLDKFINNSNNNDKMKIKTAYNGLCIWYYEILLKNLKI